MKILTGDCKDVMARATENSVDAIVTDPPYGLAFMGKEWDHGVPGVPFWTEALRVIKPGGHLVAFGGTRTYHRLACAIEDAGFEVRDCLMWLYGTGFPKSLDVGKAIDKAAGAERESTRTRTVAADRWTGPGRKALAAGISSYDIPETTPATDAAKQWDGWGTALKPAWEPIILARKPLTGTVAANVLEHGTGALNVDGCRVEAGAGDYDHPGNLKKTRMARNSYAAAEQGAEKVTQAPPNPAGRWPANLVLDFEAGEMLDAQSGDTSSTRIGNPRNPVAGFERCPSNLKIGNGRETHDFRDSGGASRFFYCAKASKSERGEGNTHPTVKPLSLMRWLCRLITPPGGVILDPFMGSGSTGVAAIAEGFDFIGIEQNPEYAEIARKRMEDK